jgi:class 3 adenylate cyclase
VTETERHAIRTLVASFLFTDLVEYSKGTVAQQYAAKANLSAVLRRNLAALHDADYKIKDTGDGALIAFVSNPEHALYMALAIAEDFGRAAGEAGIASDSLRTGVHLGSVKESTDMEARPNFVGDGINAAKRIMDFASPGQITASRAFFDAVACLDSAYADLFTHVGAPDDKHGRAHDLYAIAPSAAVLEKLRLELAQDAPEPAASPAIAAKGLAIEAKREATSVLAADAPSRASVSVRKVALVVIAVIALGVGSVFVASKLTEPNAAKSPPTASDNVVAPATPKQAEQVPAPPTSTQQSAVDSQASSAPPTKPEPPPPLPAASVAKDASAPDSTQPATAPTTTAAKTSPKIKPKTDALPAAPAPTDVASDKNSPRCSRIMEKATLGETLSTEEKKELASSCR